MKKLNLRNIGATLLTGLFITSCSAQLEKGLVGHWKLKGDLRDYSGNGNNGVGHGTNTEKGIFSGEGNYIEVPNSSSLQLGKGDFSISVWVYTEKELSDIVGDILDKYDPSKRKGVTFYINSSAGGYQGSGTDKHVYFGIDNARMSGWQDCGKPNPESNYISNSMTVYKGKLYAASMGAKDEKDWAHVYRYDGGKKWTDCGRVGNKKTMGVLPMIVHNGNLYAATSTYDWSRVQDLDFDGGRVYRYAGGTNWEDAGLVPNDSRSLNCLSSYKGKLYVGGGPFEWGVYRHDEGDKWKTVKLFDRQGPKKCFPHTMRVYRGKLYVGFPSVYSFDGNDWEYNGVPAEPEKILQTHSLTVYQGKLTAGTWPLAKVSRFLGGEKWEEIGRVGEEGTEVNALVVYNGKLYGGSIPKSEVCRYDDAPQWTSLKQFYSPEGWKPAPPIENGGNPIWEELTEWSRVTSLTLFQGRMFASIASCTGNIVDAPADVRGSVFSIEAGKNVSYDNDLGHGWKHITAIRNTGVLKLYIDGRLVAESSAFLSSDYDISNDRPLRIGFGQSDYFSGKMADVRLYNRSLSEQEIQKLFASKP